MKRDSNGTPCCNGDRVRFEFEGSVYEENWKNRCKLPTV